MQAVVLGIAWDRALSHGPRYAGDLGWVQKHWLVKVSGHWATSSSVSVFAATRLLVGLLICAALGAF